MQPAQTSEGFVEIRSALDMLKYHLEGLRTSLGFFYDVGHRGDLIGEHDRAYVATSMGRIEAAYAMARIGPGAFLGRDLDEYRED